MAKDAREVWLGEKLLKWRLKTISRMPTPPNRAATDYRYLVLYRPGKLLNGFSYHFPSSCFCSRANPGICLFVCVFLSLFSA
jgi:hypothetical protein